MWPLTTRTELPVSAAHIYTAHTRREDRNRQIVELHARYFDVTPQIRDGVLVFVCSREKRRGR